ncbi:NAD(P)(+)--arginine ADP-ribosyltransferase 2-like [Misgurnus anguillicaudatus]|uniref:NAD(P)(+)--arginine ADP-ribosyltransferase 2-like n=1 Tax=Misgurnus anguillicaudatus TaxID=75329 RepID=UPI003CCF2857
MLITAALILIVTSKFVLGHDFRRPVKEEIIPLDMAPDSVDDRYDGCRKEMKNLVSEKYLNKETCSDISEFGEAYIYSTGDIPGPHKLKMHHLIAIYVYTGHVLFERFNHDVRTGRQKYKDKTYKWYSQHFLLTEAIQILKKTQKGCKLTYSGTKLTVNENVLNREIRFGSFVSTSRTSNVAMKFGSESCFEIKTCEGADVSKFSPLPNEKEVLIPPYETFKVTDIKKRGQKGAWCKTVFVLKSTGIKSNLNCAVASVETKKYHNVTNLKYLNYL